MRSTLMTVAEPTAELHTQFSDPDATPQQWAAVVDVLARSEMIWLSTVRRDGRPHVTQLRAIWVDGALHLATASTEQKAKNLEFNPRCILTTGTNEFRSGLDVVVEGTATRVAAHPELERLAAKWNSKLGWPFQVTDGAFEEADGRVAHVFRVAPAKVLAFGKGTPHSQTRYRFTA
jgi:hypothetical protein